MGSQREMTVASKLSPAQERAITDIARIQGAGRQSLALLPCKSVTATVLEDRALIKPIHAPDGIKWTLTKEGFAIAARLEAAANGITEKASVTPVEAVAEVTPAPEANAVKWKAVRTTFTMVNEGDVVQVKWGTGAQDAGKLYPAPVKAPKSAFWAVVKEVKRNGRYVSLVVELSHTGRLVMESAAHGAITVARDVKSHDPIAHAEREAGRYYAVQHMDELPEDMALKLPGAITHNCGLCGPRTAPACGVCYPADSAGNRLPEVSLAQAAEEAAAAHFLSAEAEAGLAAIERDLAESLIGKHVRVTRDRLASPRMGLVTGRYETTAGDQYVEIDFGGITDSALAASVTVVKDAATVAAESIFSGDTSDVDAGVEAIDAWRARTTAAEEDTLFGHEVTTLPDVETQVAEIHDALADSSARWSRQRKSGGKKVKRGKRKAQKSARKAQRKGH